MLHKRLKIKKGFTLIELIVSIAILAILYPAISTAFVNTQQVMRDEDAKLDTAASAQHLIQMMQVIGRDDVGKIQTEYTRNTPNEASFYIYYDTPNDFDLTIDKIIDFGAQANTPIIESGEQGNASGAVSNIQAGINSRYAANVHIVWDNPSAQYFKTYKVTVTVFDMRHGLMQSSRTAYIGE